MTNMHCRYTIHVIYAHVCIIIRSVADSAINSITMHAHVRHGTLTDHDQLMMKLPNNSKLAQVANTQTQSSK